MHSGPEQFRDWMSRRGFNQSEAAAFFGWHESVISQYLSRDRRPNLTNALLIEEHTGIPPKAWMSRERDKSREMAVTSVGKRKVHKA